MLKQAFVVVGLGFGDEGKGLATDFLCRHTANPLVIRFNGGHQAGHTVVTAAGIRHVFSNFGSGTLRGVPTYWSSYCTFSPTAVLQELSTLPLEPRLLVDRRCPVTTHYDILYNRAVETNRGDSRHGSCGVGFGATIERHAHAPVRLYAQDLLHPAEMATKLQAIRQYYQQKIEQDTSFSFTLFDHDTADQQFKQQVKEVIGLSQRGIIQFVDEEAVFAADSPWHTYIFEGAQGVLLDMDYGCYPHVTRSNTTSKNALNLLQRHLPAVAATAEVLYVTRAYQTRHGNGPFTDCRAELRLVNCENETNQHNTYQGSFRLGYLDVDSLNHALACDANFSSALRKRLLVTCLDQLTGQLPVVQKGVLHFMHHSELPALLNDRFTHVYFSFSNSSEPLLWDA